MANSLRNLLICVLGLTRESSASWPRATSRTAAIQSCSSRARSCSIARRTSSTFSRRRRSLNAKKRSSADEATATASTSTLERVALQGHVRVVVDTAELTADTAVFTFADKKLSRGQLLGTATFVDKQTKDNAGGQQALLRQQRKTLLLSDNAQVNKAQYEIQGGCDLLYDLNEKRVTSGPTVCKDPNRIRMLPTEKPPHQDGEAPAAAPAQ